MILSEQHGAQSYPNGMCLCHLGYSPWYMLCAGIPYQLALACAWLYDSTWITWSTELPQWNAFILLTGWPHIFSNQIPWFFPDLIWFSLIKNLNIIAMAPTFRSHILTQMLSSHMFIHNAVTIFLIKWKLYLKYDVHVLIYFHGSQNQNW